MRLGKNRHFHPYIFDVGIPWIKVERCRRGLGGFRRILVMPFHLRLSARSAYSVFQNRTLTLQPCSVQETRIGRIKADF